VPSRRFIRQIHWLAAKSAAGHEACRPVSRIERRRSPHGASQEVTSMLMTVFVVLLVLWLLGVVSSYTMGGFIHLLLILAIAVILIRVIQGRRPV
jgi:uncharacterized membrane protein